MSNLPDVEPTLAALAGDLTRYLGARERAEPRMIGIRTGGVWVARRLHRDMGLASPLGELNISFYRDDFTRIGLHPQVQPTMLPFEVDGGHILLVDDVLHTGRTVRAALNEIFDYGRPASVTLAALVERSGRELPVCADVAGARLELQDGEHVKLLGPDPLRLELQRTP